MLLNIMTWKTSSGTHRVLSKLMVYWPNSLKRFCKSNLLQNIYFFLKLVVPFLHRIITLLWHTMCICLHKFKLTIQNTLMLNSPFQDLFNDWCHVTIIKKLFSVLPGFDENSFNQRFRVFQGKRPPLKVFWWYVCYANSRWSLHITPHSYYVFVIDIPCATNSFRFLGFLMVIVSFEVTANEQPSSRPFFW